jgi:hypothetical protein
VKSLTIGSAPTRSPKRGIAPIEKAEVECKKANISLSYQQKVEMLHPSIQREEIFNLIYLTYQGVPSRVLNSLIRQAPTRVLPSCAFPFPKIS